MVEVNYELSVVVGVLVSLFFQIIKKLTKINFAEATVKQVAVAVLAAVTVFIANNWAIDIRVLYEAVLAIVAALANHKLLLKSS